MIMDAHELAGIIRRASTGDPEFQNLKKHGVEVEWLPRTGDGIKFLTSWHRT
jgi:hypothetical protein